MPIMEANNYRGADRVDFAMTQGSGTQMLEAAVSQHTPRSWPQETKAGWQFPVL